MLYLNLPVSDLNKAITFYEAIGFTKNADFSNDSAAAMVYDDHLSVMLLTHDFIKGFLPAHKTIADTHTTCSALYALPCSSKQAVDEITEKALAAGAKATISPYDHGFMYGRDIEDLDGHIWEFFWMASTQSVS